MNIKIWLTIAVFVIALITISISVTIHNENLLKDSQITDATIIDMRQLSRGKVVVEYFFKAGSVVYNGSNLCRRDLFHDKEFFLGKHLPVIYANKNPKISEIFISPEIFEKHKMNIPDSLNWIKKYYN